MPQSILLSVRHQIVWLAQPERQEAIRLKHCHSHVLRQNYWFRETSFEKKDVATVFKDVLFRIF